MSGTPLLPPDLPDIEEPDWADVLKEGIEKIRAGRPWYSPELWASVIFPRIPGLAQLWRRAEKRRGPTPPASGDRE